VRRSAILLVVTALACGERDATPRHEDGGVGRRVFDPPPRKVRAVPPYRIADAGIGPYRLGDPLREVFELLPGGPRVELLQLERLVDFSLVRTDGDKLVIGADRSAAVAFVAALGPGVARTEDGVEVGTSVDEVERHLGPRAAAPAVVDPRLIRYAAAPGLRIVALDGAVAALLVAATPPAGRPRAAPRCPRRLESELALVTAARLKAGARVHLGCFTGAGGEALVVGPTGFAVVGGVTGRVRRLLGDAREDLAFGGALDLDGDARDEIVLVRRPRGDALVVAVEVLSVEGGRLVPRLGPGGATVYQLATPAAEWIGARLRDLDVLIEVAGSGDGVAVGGVFVRRGPGGLRDVAPLSPVALPLSRGRRRGGEPGGAAASGATGAAEEDAGPPPGRDAGM
jgi:hypothetical protein